MTIALLSLMLAAQAPADAAGWVQIYTADDGTRAYYEPASVARGEEVVRVRFRALPGGNVGQQVREFVATEEVNCARRTTTTVALTAQFVGGGQTEVPLDGRADAVNPNTPAAALFDIVCAAPPAT